MWRSSTLLWLSYAILSLAQSQYGSSPPVYPSRKQSYLHVDDENKFARSTGAGGWEDALKKAQAFVDQLSLEEKAGMVTGTPGPCVGNIGPIIRLDFGGLCLQDGPLALRQSIYSSVFPAGLSGAASWDRELVKERSALMAKEFRGKGSHVLLGPVVGPLGRSPFGGRNWEGFSPDAYLSGVLVEESVKGIQEQGVQACTKHFIGNEQESQRNPSYVDNVKVEAVSSNIDDKTMHETYLWPFANAVRAGSASVMSSYQRINGSYGGQNSKALNGLLKEELGFQGYVMSDWGGTRSGIPAILAGLDMNMPVVKGGFDFATDVPSFFGPNVTTGVKNGSLSIDRVDDMVLRIMTPYFFLGQDSSYPPIDETCEPLNFFPPSNYKYEYPLGPLVDVRANHYAHIRKLGAAGAVLLKNTDNVLPLKQPKTIGVFGNGAPDPTLGLLPADNQEIGAMAVGGGSGTGRLSYIVSPLSAIQKKAASYGALVQYITANWFVIQHGFGHLAPAPPEACIVFVKSWASEGGDRGWLEPDWDGSKVVDSTAAFCANTIVVLHGAAPNVLPWKDHENVTAIIAAHMPGQEIGNSIVDILWGSTNPSGKLPYTIANAEKDYNKNIADSEELRKSKDPNAWQANFTEGNLIDYKEFDAGDKPVAYEFGFGLSYTTFEISDMKITVTTDNTSRTPSTDADIAPGGNVELWAVLANVTATVKNTGEIEGATVPQLYISLPAEAGDGTPVRSLRGFEKVQLGVGESQSVVFPLMRRDLSYWDVNEQTWRLPEDEIGVDVGFSSRDLKLKDKIQV